ncbi:MAG: nitroreductase family protein [Prevotellaceae bacterium]|jgi:nitroreductase|nr:nitroreductase family protein [Prevotellaceae bacterium]
MSIKQLIKEFLPFYKDYSNNQEVIFAELRVRCHILDKGIHVVPFEKGHSFPIYKQCIELRNKLTDKQIFADESYNWACSVIEHYEKLQRDKNVVLNKSIVNNYSEKDKEFFYKIIRSRTSSRNYINKKVPDELWTEMIDIANDAPSGCCRYSSRYYVESDEKTIFKLLPNIAGATAYSDKIPHLICVTADTRLYCIKDASFLPTIDTTLTIQNFLLACTINNIYTAPLNWQHATEKQNKAVRQILNIPNYEQIILFISAGYSDIVPEKPIRLNVNWIRKK